MGRDVSSSLAVPIEARQRLGLPTVGRILLYAGRFAPTHPLHLLLDAAPILMERFRLIHFVLIGDGMTRRSLEAIARDRALDAAVIFAGDVPSEMVPDFVTACDIGLTLSSSFGSEVRPFRTTDIWPFMKGGRAVVAASDLADARTFVRANDIGAACELRGEGRKDVDRLVDATSSLLADDAARLRCGENARLLARTLGQDTAAFGFLKASIRRVAVL